jgi:hypothetical protein
LLQQEIQTNALCITSEGPILVKNNTITPDNQSFEIIYNQNCPLATVKTVTENTADYYTHNKMQKLELR